MIYRTAKLALLGALVAIGLSPGAINAQQRETKQAAASREEGAQEKASKSESDKDTAKKAPAGKAASDSQGKDRLSVTPEREAAVMTFVKRNHADLSDLL